MFSSSFSISFSLSNSLSISSFSISLSDPTMGERKKKKRVIDYPGGFFFEKKKETNHTSRSFKVFHVCNVCCWCVGDNLFGGKRNLSDNHCTKAKKHLKIENLNGYLIADFVSAPIVAD